MKHLTGYKNFDFEKSNRKKELVAKNSRNYYKIERRRISNKRYHRCVIYV